MEEKDILERHFLELADVLVDVLKLTGILLPGFRAEDQKICIRCRFWN